jgi:prepilin-type processing-associated H-X9-DG protein
MDAAGFDKWGNGVWYDNSVPENGVSAYVGGADNLYRLIVCPANRASKPPVATRTPYGFPYICNYELMPQNGVNTPPPHLGSIDTSKCILLVDAGIGADWKGPGFTSYGGWDRMAERHGERMNVLWADGHISWMRKANIKRSDILPVPR